MKILQYNKYYGFKSWTWQVKVIIYYICIELLKKLLIKNKQK